MISIGTTRFSAFKGVAASIKRLWFERENIEEYFNRWESKDLKLFSSVREIHVVCADGLDAWWGATKDHYWPCGEKNVWFIDPEEDNFKGRIYSAFEMEDMLDREAEKRLTEEGSIVRAVRGDWVPLDHDKGCNCCFGCSDSRHYAASNDLVWLLGLERRDPKLREITLDRFGLTS